MNNVKGREWFRPFAGSVMQEHAKDWFDLRGMDETPFMMYAVELQDKAIGELPAVTHVEGSARFQTINEETNPHYYILVKAFYKLTGVPVLLNTSLNGNGEPMVETPEEALNFFKNSNLDMMFINGKKYG